MPFTEVYRRQVALLVRVLPFVAEEKCFALKGGTAINLFVRDLPRLSVDIDLAYIPIKSRTESLTEVDAAMKRIAARIKHDNARAQINESYEEPEHLITRLVIRVDGLQIKIEVTPVMRGSVYPPETRTVRPAVEDTFGYAEIQVLSFADLYGGKIVAALDRQHPRDFFDVRDLFAHEGIDDALRRAFIVYLLCHNRPMHEVLAAKRKKIDQEYLRGFSGMTETEVTLEQLSDSREQLIDSIVGDMPQEHRRFLIAFEEGNPDWSLLGVPEAADLPAVRWRQQNLNKLSKEARAQLVASLRAVLKMSDEK
jgi:predicted nucleotidyltransferase component of viral defense system